MIHAGADRRASRRRKASLSARFISPGASNLGSALQSAIRLIQIPGDIFRLGSELKTTCDKLAELKGRYARARVDDSSSGWNTAWLLALELGYQLDVAEAMAHSALERRESRGSHQRLDGHTERDDEHYLKHTLAHCEAGGAPRIDYCPVTITRSPPGVRAYGAAGEAASLEGNETRKEKQIADG